MKLLSCVNESDYYEFKIDSRIEHAIQVVYKL